VAKKTRKKSVKESAREVDVVKADAKRAKAAQFTHVLQPSQPYFYDDARGAPNGEFAAGTRVVIIVHYGGAYCRLVDGQGLYVETACAGLRRL
jgi:hypothetical protein